MASKSIKLTVLLYHVLLYQRHFPLRRNYIQPSLTSKKCTTELTEIYNGIIFYKKNVSTKFVNACKSMYKRVKLAVRFKNDTSQPIHLNIGVKQGDHSSSILCLLFINDIIKNIKNCR